MASLSLPTWVKTDTVCKLLVVTPIGIRKRQTETESLTQVCDHRTIYLILQLLSFRMTDSQVTGYAWQVLGYCLVRVEVIPKSVFWGVKNMPPAAARRDSGSVCFKLMRHAKSEKMLVFCYWN